MRKATLIILVGLGVLLLCLFGFYMYETMPVDRSSNADVEVVIPQGMSTRNIAKLLKNKNLIRNDTFFMIYVKLNRKSSIKASTYELKKNMSMDKIVNILNKGNTYNPDVLRITFKEGESITKYAKEIAKKTDNSYDDVIKTINDKEYLKTLIDKYWFLTDDILNGNIYYSLEGYLYPETIEFKNKEVSPKEIIETYLKHTDKVLSKDKDKLTKGKYKIHEYLTLASILQLEGRNTKDRRMIMGVFENRLAKGMNLGSDVTTYYGLKKEMDSDLSVEEFNRETPYNTRTNNMVGKLPVGPICNPELDSIEAVLNPTKNDYLFFVADKNGKVYYTKTNAEHTKKVQELKDNNLWIW